MRINSDGFTIFDEYFSRSLPQKYCWLMNALLCTCEWFKMINKQIVDLSKCFIRIFIKKRYSEIKGTDLFKSITIF